MTQALWDSYLASAKGRYEEIDEKERYKIELGKALKRAREALLRGERDWPKLVKAAITHGKNINIHWRNHSKLTEWIDGNVDEAREALRKMWSEAERTPGDRVRAFDACVPESVFSRGFAGARLNVASYLMMGIDPHRYPPYRHRAFRGSYGSLDYPLSSAGDVGSEYEHALRTSSPRPFADTSSASRCAPRGRCGLWRRTAPAGAPSG